MTDHVVPTPEEHQVLERVFERLAAGVVGEPSALAIAAVVMLLGCIVEDDGTPMEILAALSASLTSVQQEITQRLQQRPDVAAAPIPKESLH